MGMENLEAVLSEVLQRWCKAATIVSGILIVACLVAIFLLSKP